MRQIQRAPAWFQTDRFDIIGKPDVDGQPNTKQLGIMLQKLLAERFKLTFHHEQKELSAYTIMVGKTGPKLKKTEGNPNSLPGLGFRGRPVDLSPATRPSADFAGFMQTLVLDRPVVDKTGLDTRYDFTLDWTPDETQFLDRSGPGFHRRPIRMPRPSRICSPQSSSNWG